MKGKSSDVESVCNDIEKLIDNFSLEEFVITCPPFLSGLWKKKCAPLKLEESHNVMIKYDQHENDTKVMIVRPKKDAINIQNIIEKQVIPTRH